MPCLKIQGRKVWAKFHNEGKNGKENIAQIFLRFLNLSSKDSIVSHTFVQMFVVAPCPICQCQM
jgi:hypothetical protein